MTWGDAGLSLLPVAAIKTVSLPEPSWFEVSPEMLAYAAFAALLLVILYVFSR
jgi:hypothetical protein